MTQGIGTRRGFGAARGLLLVTGLLASCAPRVEGPAPIVSGETPSRAEWVTVQRGQTLSGIAQTYHVPMRVLAEANSLSPPYRIQAGRSLMIPAAGYSPIPIPAAPTSIAPIAPARPEDASQPASALQSSTVPGGPESVAVDRAVQAPPEKSSVAAVPLTAPPALTIPPGGEIHAPPKPAPTAPAPEPSTSSATPGAPAHTAGAFLWPVRGRVLATYGSRTDGTHNDGINIGAPKGAAVQAVDAGVVAYTGNELRSYGNLILVKHGNGWISAYAHCDLVLVKRGEKVARGQVIARVGSSGNVSEPQLHFELRRGNHPVDPREFLAPLPTAATKETRSG